MFYMPPNTKFISICITSSINNVCLQEVVGMAKNNENTYKHIRNFISWKKVQSSITVGQKQLHHIHLYLAEQSLNPITGWIVFLWRSLLACTWIKLTISPVLLGFQPPNFTQVLLQPSSTRSWLKPHPPINELAIVTALSRQPLAQTGINASPSEMGAVQGKRTVFSTCLCIGGQQWPTQSQQRHFQSGAQRQPCCLHPSGAPTHLPLLRLFCCGRTYLLRSLQEVTSQDESFMPDISGYIRERVNCLEQYCMNSHCGLTHETAAFYIKQSIAFLQPWSLARCL